uniref:F-box/kelch-repeat protein n=1 Tax=Mesocestoides corti TaxID=53468 RepID=A0A5K3FMM0_MESCO
VVVVGGNNDVSGNLCTAELLSCSTEDNGVENWSWRRLAPMMKPRTYPGVAYFRGRVVVAGGDSGCIHDIEFLRLPADDNDPGQWTQLDALQYATPLKSSLVVLNERLVLADLFGKVHVFLQASESNALTPEEFTYKPIFTIQNVDFDGLLALRKRR